MDIIGLDLHKREPKHPVSGRTLATHQAILREDSRNLLVLLLPRLRWDGEAEIHKVRRSGTDYLGSRFIQVADVHRSCSGLGKEGRLGRDRAVPQEARSVSPQAMASRLGSEAVLSRTYMYDGVCAQ